MITANTQRNIDKDTASVVAPSHFLTFSATGNGIYDSADFIKNAGWKVIDEMVRTDPRVSAYVGFLFDVVVGTGSDFVASSEETESEEEEKIEFLRWNRDSFFEGNWADGLAKIYRGILSGFSVTEKIYERCDYGPFKGRIMLRALRDKNPEHFSFDQDVYGNLKPDGLVQFHLTADEIRHDVRKFVIWSREPWYSNLNGHPILESIYGAYFCGKVLRREGNILVEKTATGLTISYVPDSWSEAQMRAHMSDMEKMHGACDYVVKAGTKIEFPSPPSGSLDMIQSWINQYNDAEALGLRVAPTLFNLGDTGAYAATQTHKEVFVLGAQRQQATLDDVATDQIVRDLCEINFGPGPYPRHKMRAVDFNSVESVKLRYEAMKSVGKRPTAAAVARDLSISEDDIEDAPEPVAQPFGAPKNAKPTVAKTDDAEMDDERANSLVAAEGERRALTRPERRVAFAELDNAEKQAVASGAEKIKEGLARLRNEALGALREVAEARRPLAPRTSTRSSRIARALRADSGKR